MIIYHIPCKHPGCTALIEYDPQLVMHGHQPESMLDVSGAEEAPPRSVVLQCPHGHYNRISFKQKTRYERAAPLDSVIETQEIV